MREKATGRFAGYTEFRGRGLGRWLQAAMIQKVLAPRAGLQARPTWQVGLDKVLAYLNG